MKAIAIWFLILPFTLAVAQRAPQKPRVYAVPCTGTFDAQSCRSYNQMITAKDLGLLADLAEPNYVSVCFNRSDDSFIVLSLMPPRNFKETEIAGIATALGTISFIEYQDGTSRDRALFVGSWTKTPSDLSFSGQDSLYPQSYATVSASEIAVWFLSRRFLLRLSTMRYSQFYAIQLPNGQSANVFDVGTCASFPTQ